METFSAWMRLEIPRSKSPLVPSLRSAATAKLTSGPAMVSELPTWTPTRAARSITAAVRFQNHDEQRNHLDHLETCGGKIRGTNRKRWHFWNQNNDGKTPRRFLRLAMEICTKNRSQSLDWDAESFKSIVSRGSTKGQIKVLRSRMCWMSQMSWTSTHQPVSLSPLEPVKSEMQLKSIKIS